jgi:septum formation protein
MFILASSSVSRRKLLKGYRFRVVPPGVREVSGRTLRATCVTNAKRKAAAVSARFPDTWVLAADTLIEYGGKIYGKPRTRKDAIRLIRLLLGQTHLLGTAAVLQKGHFKILRYVTSKVTLHAQAPVEALLRRYDPTRFAGGYAIRPKNDPLISRIDGSVSNVVGLPMETLGPLLKSLAGGT